MVGIVIIFIIILLWGESILQYTKFIWTWTCSGSPLCYEFKMLSSQGPSNIVNSRALEKIFYFLIHESKLLMIEHCLLGGYKSRAGDFRLDFSLSHSLKLGLRKFWSYKRRRHETVPLSPKITILFICQKLYFLPLLTLVFSMNKAAFFLLVKEEHF